VIARATLADERVVVGTVATIAALVSEARIEGPALLVVGEVVDRRVESPAAHDDLGATTTRMRGLAG
jgi:siroheme synthase